MKVFINPGHAPNGNPDPGAINQSLKMRECDVALDVGMWVEKYLNSWSIETKLVQDDSLAYVCSESNKFDADVFVSIHCNAFNAKARGTETWYFYNSKNGLKLAECVQYTLQDKGGRLDRGVKPAKPGVNGLYVLTNTNAPAVLVEIGFIDQLDDAVYMHNHKDYIGLQIARGIYKFLTGDQ